MLLASFPPVFFGVFAGDLALLAGDLALLAAGDLALLAGVFALELVAAFLVGDLALAGDLALLFAGVLCCALFREGKRESSQYGDQQVVKTQSNVY